jgi:imidazolonepropionase
VEITLSSCDLIVHNGHIATMAAGGPAYGPIRDGLIAVRKGRIAWIGAEADAPASVTGNPGAMLDLDGGWVTPGLIDAHTHLVFGGDRAREFEQRLEGASYEEIARAGGGILSTVTATRDATEESLLAQATARLRTLMDQGVTSIEIKSGYGLDLDSELRMLRVARDLGARHQVTVSTTLLGAHALPPEYEGRPEAYIDLVCSEMIPDAARLGLADAVDAFCEGIGFTPVECERVLRAGREHGLASRLHADQLSDLDGAALAARCGARSADHLEYTSEGGVRAMAEAGTSAVLLPGAYYFLGDTQAPPVETFRQFSVPMVVATDMNPGSSPLGSPLLAMNLACSLFRLTPEEALAGMTRCAAPVLGFADRGVLAEGQRADLACWAVDHPAELSYWMGMNPCLAVVHEGELRVD